MPDGGGVADRIPDATVISEVRRWMTGSLGCVAGRREYQRQRYLIDTVYSPLDIQRHLSRFVAGVRKRRYSACLFVFNEPEYYASSSAACEQALAFLAGRMACVSRHSAAELLNGGNLGFPLLVNCPVTEMPVVYDDFEAIAFCPQAANAHDPLYDPLMSSPYTMVNLSSDYFAFALFVRETALSTFSRAPCDLDSIEQLAQLFDRCAEIWQRMAENTIRTFQSRTDVSLCPVHLTEDSRGWVAAHRDPAFAERVKTVHVHDMPRVYTRPAIDCWMRFFVEGVVPEKMCSGPPGRPV